MASAKNNVWPEDSVQGFVGEWWVQDPLGQATRGALAYAWVPHVEQVPKLIIPEGRLDTRDHSSFKVSIRPFDDAARRRTQLQTGLPVAAVPLHADEILLGVTARERPVLIISDEPGLQTERFSNWTGKMLMAPYTELIGDSGTSSAPPEFVIRVRRAYYPSLVWDMPPSEMGAVESILRLDCIQPVARGAVTLRMSGWRLTDSALEVMEDWFVWLRRGGLPQGSDLREIQTALHELG